eukprot:6558611-Pyramimonas_sp.AAC.1
MLEGKDELKAMLAPSEFQEFAKLFTSHYAAAGARAQSDSSSPSDGGVDVPTPLDAEMDGAFTDEAAAEAFWEKHRGDKRAFTQALMVAKLKKPKTASL